MHRRDFRRHVLRTRREFFGSEAHDAVLAQDATAAAQRAPARLADTGGASETGEAARGAQWPEPSSGRSHLM